MKLKGLAKKLRQEQSYAGDNIREIVADDTILFNGTYISVELYRRLNPAYFNRRVRKISPDYLVRIVDLMT